MRVQGLTVSKSKRHHQSSILSQHNWLETVVEAKVASSEDHDVDTRDDKATVETHETVRLDRLDIHVNHAVELPLT